MSRESRRWRHTSSTAVGSSSAHWVATSWSTSSSHRHLHGRHTWNLLACHLHQHSICEHLVCEFNLCFRFLDFNLLFSWILPVKVYSPAFFEWVFGTQRVYWSHSRVLNHLEISIKEKPFKFYMIDWIHFLHSIFIVWILMWNLSILMQFLLELFKIISDACFSSIRIVHDWL